MRTIYFIDSVRLIQCAKLFSKFLRETNACEDLRRYCKESNLTSYGHLLDKETIDDHIV